MQTNPKIGSYDGAIDDAVRVRTTMKYLVSCSCGHSLEDHDGEGCSNTAMGPCACRLDQLSALDTAIERAKTEAVATWRSPSESSDSVGA